MSGQETLITKKRSGPKPTGKGTLIGVRLHPPLLDAIDQIIEAESEPKPSRPDVIRRILEAELLKTP